MPSCGNQLHRSASASTCLGARAPAAPGSTWLAGHLHIDSAAAAGDIKWVSLEGPALRDWHHWVHIPQQRGPAPIPSSFLWRICPLFILHLNMEKLLLWLLVLAGLSGIVAQQGRGQRGLGQLGLGRGWSSQLAALGWGERRRWVWSEGLWQSCARGEPR